MLVVVALAGCIEADIQVCGKQICPTTQVCIDNERCVSPEAIAQCDGVPLDDGCTLGDIYGRCTAHANNTVVCDPAKCGDNVLDDPLNEQCDTKAPFKEQCVDLGYDTGRLGCTSECRFDPFPCQLFGWDTVVSASAFAMWTDGTVLAYASYYPRELRITGGGFDVHGNGVLDKLDGGGGRVVVLAYDSVHEYTPTGDRDLAAPFNPSSATDLAVAEDGTAYVSVACTIWRHSADEWKVAGVLSAVGFCGSLLAVSPASTGSRVFATWNNAVYEILPGGPVSRLTIPTFSNLYDMVAADDEGAVLYFAADTGLHYWDGANVTTPVTGKVTTVAIGAQHVFAADSGSVTRVENGGSDLAKLTAPVPRLTDDGHGNVYAYGGSIFVFTGTSFGDLPPPDLGNIDERFVDVVTPPGQPPLFLSTHNLLQRDRTTWISLGDQLSPVSSHAIGALDLDHYAVSGYLDDNIFFPGQLWVRAQPNDFADVFPPGGPWIDGVWMASNGTVFTAGTERMVTSGFLGQWSGTSTLTGTWVSETHAGCEFHGIDALSASDVWAVGACNGVAELWHYDGTSWTASHTEPAIASALWDVRVFPTGEIFAIGDGGVVWRLGGTWYSDATVAGRSISGTPTDLWVTGLFTVIQHYDGGSWSKVTTRALGQMVVHATPSFVTFAGATEGSVSLLRE